MKAVSHDHRSDCSTSREGFAAGVLFGAKGGTVRFGPEKKAGMKMTDEAKCLRPLMFAYTRVSTEDQADKRNGLEAQRAAIEAEAERRLWDIEQFADEAASGKRINPKLAEALELLANGQGDGLIVAKLDRLSRSIIDAANIIECAERQGWSLVVLDLGVDLTTPAGEAMAHMMATFAQFERRMISERTKSALAAKKARGESIGRPRLAKPGVVRRIVMDRQSGLSFARIANALEAEGVLSPAGRPNWQSSTVRRIYQSATAVANLEVIA